MLKLFDHEFLPILADIALMLSRALTDSFPEVKKEASLLVVDFAEKLPKKIGHHSISVVKNLGLNLSH